MNRKGIFETTEIAVVTLILAVAISGIGIQKVMSLEQIVKKETLPISGSRVESSAYMLDGVKEGKAEMKLKDDYRVEKKDGEIFLIYTMEDSVFRLGESQAATKLDPPTQLVLHEEGLSDRICLDKTDKYDKDSDVVEIKPGECSG